MGIGLDDSCRGVLEHRESSTMEPEAMTGVRSGARGYVVVAHGILVSTQIPLVLGFGV